MNKLDWYIGKTILLSSVVVALIFLSLVFLSELLLVLDNISEHFTMTDALLIALCYMPNSLNQMLPVVVIIGTIAGMGSMAKANELIVMQVSGLSVGVLFVKSIKAVLVIWVLAVLVTEFVMPKSAHLHEVLSAKSSGRQVRINEGSELWLKHDNSLIRIGQIVDNSLLRGVRVIRYDEKNRVTNTLVAKLARAGIEQTPQTGIKALTKEQQTQWLLEGVTTQAFHYSKDALTGADSIQLDSHQHQSLSVYLPLDKDFFASISLTPNFLSVWDIIKQLRFRLDNKLDATQYDIEFWQRISQPFLLAGLVAIVFPLIFGSQRSTGTAKRLFIGVMFGMIVFLLNQLIFNFAVVYGLAGWLGVGLPTLAYCMLGLFRIYQLVKT